MLILGMRIVMGIIGYILNVIYAVNQNGWNRHYRDALLLWVGSKRALSLDTQTYDLPGRHGNSECCMPCGWVRMA